MVKRRWLLPFVVIGVIAVATALMVNAPVKAAPIASPQPASRVVEPPAQETETYCLSCHGQPVSR